jgi:hypothetical protein
VLFIDGNGRHLTDREWIATIEREKATKADEAAAKLRRADVREGKKAAKAALKEEWNMMLEAHQKELQEWNTKCEALTAQNVLKKNLPKRPLRPKKPRLMVPTSPECDPDHGRSDSDSSDSDG